MLKVKECARCGQGFDEDNNPVGRPVPSTHCINGVHEGPVNRVGNQGLPSNVTDTNAISTTSLKKSVFFIYGGFKFDQDSNRDVIDHDLFPVGTAFFISQEYAVTARHTVFNSTHASFFPFLFLSPGGEPKKIYLHFSMEIASENEDYDIAILKINDGSVHTEQFFSIASINEVPNLSAGSSSVRAVWSPIQLSLKFSEDRPITIDFQERTKILHYCPGFDVPPATNRVEIIIGRNYHQDQESIARSVNNSLVVVEGGLSGGSCGSPYVVPHTMRVLAMHLASTNEENLNIPALIGLSVKNAENRAERKRKIDRMRSTAKKAAKAASDVADEKEEDEKLSESTDYTEAYFSVKEGLILSKCPWFVKWMRTHLTVDLNPTIT